jgi:hypothetical protein
MTARGPPTNRHRAGARQTTRPQQSSRRCRSNGARRASNVAFRRRPSFRSDRRGAALRARRAQAARGSAGALPPDSGFGGGTRLQTFRTPSAWSEIRRRRQAIPGGCTAYSSGGKRCGRTRRPRCKRPFGRAARRIYRECVVAGRGSGILPAVSGAATGRRTPTSASSEYGTVRNYKIRPVRCRVRRFYAKIRPGIGPTSRRPSACRACRAKGHPLTLNEATILSLVSTGLGVG